MSRIGLTAAFALTLLGCGGLPTTHYYLLEPSDVMRAAATGSDGLAIGVEPFQVDSPYDQDRIVYRTGADSAEIGYYAYHRWATPLSRMLPRVVAATYGDVPGIASIEPSAPGGKYDATLRGRVQTLEEIDGPDGVTVALALTLSLVDADGTVLWSAAPTGRGAPGPATDVGQVVTRMRSLLEGLLADARPGLTRGLQAHGNPGR